MRDAEALGEQRLRILQHDRVIGRGGHRRVHREQRFVRPDQPGVHVMNVADRRNALLERVAQLADIQPVRRALHQDVRRAAHQRPRAAHDQHAHEQRQQRIDRQPAGEQDDERCEHRGRRAEQVAEHVQRRRGDVHVVRVAPAQHREDDQVHAQARVRRPRGSPSRSTATGLMQALHGFDRDPRDDEQQRATVDERREHSQPLISEGATRIGGTSRRCASLPRRAPARRCRSACDRRRPSARATARGCRRRTPRA